MTNVDGNSSTGTQHGPETVRVPELGIEPAAFQIDRFTAVPGEKILVPLPAEAEFVPFQTYPPELEAAEKALGLGNVTEVKKELERLKDNAELSDQVKTLALRTACMTANVDEARAFYKTLENEDSVPLATAMIAIQDGDLTKARTFIEKAKSIHPDGLGENYVQALVHSAAGDARAAQESLTKVSRSAPFHVVARHQLGLILLAEGDQSRAGTLFEQAIETSPDFVPPYLSLADMFISGHQLPEAMNLLSELADRNPTLLMPRLMQLKILISAREFKAAQELANALREATTGNAEIEILWAEALWRDGQVGEGRKVLEALTTHEQATVRVSAYRQWGLSFLHSQPSNLPEALSMFEQAVTHGPDQAELRLELADICFAMSERDKGVVALEAIQAMGKKAGLGPLINAAQLAAQYKEKEIANRLADTAIQSVAGTPIEREVRGYTAQILSS